MSRLSQEQLRQCKDLVMNAFSAYVHCLELWKVESPDFLWVIIGNSSCAIGIAEPVRGNIIFLPDAVVWTTEGWRRVFENPNLERYNIIAKQGRQLVVLVPKSASEEKFVESMEALTNTILNQLQELVKDYMLDALMDFSTIKRQIQK